MRTCKTCKLCLLQHEPGACNIQSVQERQDGRRGLAHYQGYVSVSPEVVAKRKSVHSEPAPEPVIAPEPVVEFNRLFVEREPLRPALIWPGFSTSG